MAPAIGFSIAAAIVGLCPVWGLVWAVRKRLNCMAGMMVAMGQGMVAGLLAGALFGAFRPSDLWWATLAGSAAGIVTGALTGMPISLMAVLDGSLSGLMSGMMGAMLGAMIPDRVAEVAKTGAGVVLVTSLLLIILVVREVGTKYLISAVVDMFSQPLAIAIGAGLLATGLFGFWPRTPAEIREITVKASDYQFNPPLIQVKKGEPMRLRLVNTGKVEHDLVIGGMETKMPKGSHANHGSAPLRLLAKPGQEATLEFTPTETGSVKAICSIPGHKQAMSLTVMVQ